MHFRKLLWALCFSFCCSFCWAQATVPDAPSSVIGGDGEAIACIRSGGIWLNDMGVVRCVPPKAHKWFRLTYPTHWTERQVFHSKSFWVPVAVDFGAFVADTEYTHQGLAHHKCVEGNGVLPQHPSRGQLYGVNLAQWGGASAFNWLMLKSGVKFAGIVPLAYDAQGHIRGAYQWRSQCW